MTASKDLMELFFCRLASILSTVDTALTMFFADFVRLTLRINLIAFLLVRIQFRSCPKFFVPDKIFGSWTKNVCPWTK